jgi:hypothetical protein
MYTCLLLCYMFIWMVPQLYQMWNEWNEMPVNNKPEVLAKDMCLQDNNEKHGITLSWQQKTVLSF